jgi:hypothetical protein
LIGEVVITPGEKRGESHAVLRGELMAILDLAAGRRRTPRPEVITKELAGPRNQCPNAYVLSVCLLRRQDLSLRRLIQLLPVSYSTEQKSNDA